MAFVRLIPSPSQSLFSWVKFHRRHRVIEFSIISWLTRASSNRNLLFVAETVTTSRRERRWKKSCEKKRTTEFTYILAGSKINKVFFFLLALKNPSWIIAHEIHNNNNSSQPRELRAKESWGRKANFSAHTKLPPCFFRTRENCVYSLHFSCFSIDFLHSHSKLDSRPTQVFFSLFFLSSPSHCVTSKLEYSSTLFLCVQCSNTAQSVCI